MSKQVSIRLEISEEEYESEKQDAEGSTECQLGEPEVMKLSSGADRGRSHFIEPVSLVVTATVAWICKRMFDHWIKDREKGLQIDLRKDPVLFTRLEGVPNGFVVVIDKSGESKVYQAKYDKPEDLMPLVGKILAS